MQRMSKHCAVRLYKQSVDQELHTLSPSHQFRGEEANYLCMGHIRRKQIQMVSYVSKASSNMYYYSNVCRIGQQIRSVTDDAPTSRVSNSFTEEDEEKLMKKLAEESLTNKPFGYYEILGGIPRTSKISDIKHAYFRLARRYHPDAFPDKGMSLKLYLVSTSNSKFIYYSAGGLGLRLFNNYN